MRRRDLLRGLAASGLGVALAPVGSAFAESPANVPGFQPFWVQNHAVTDLWSGPDDKAVSFGRIPQWSYLHVVRSQPGTRLYVLVPWTTNYAYVDAAAVGPSGPPPEGWKPNFASPAAPPVRPAPVVARASATADLFKPAPHLWQGFVGAPTLVVRTAPWPNAPIVTELPEGTPITVDAWVKGYEWSPDHYTWGQVGPGLFGFGAAIRIIPPDAPPPLPPNAPAAGRWLDVNLTRQLVTAYENRQPVRLMITSSGRPTWDTPVGVFRIFRRVYNETMDGSTLLSLDLTAEQRKYTDYKIKNVLHTQYFTGDGNALHQNYWLPAWSFGVPRSHGCLGLHLADSTFLWGWAGIGTPLVIHK